MIGRRHGGEVAVRAWTGVAARLRPVLGFFLIGLLVLGASRAGLSLWRHAEVAEVGGWGRVFVQGLRVDVATLCLLLVPPALVLLLAPAQGAPARWIRWAMAAWLTTAIALLVFLELATPGFMDEYGLRPNRTFLEYLVYPKEVFSTLLKGRTLSIAVTTVLMLVLVPLCWRLARRWLAPAGAAKGGLVARVLVAVAVLLLGALGVRSTLGHRPMNPAMIAFSSNPTVNVLPLNSFYSLAFALRDWMREEEGAAQLYGAMADADVLAAVRASSGLPASAFTDPDIPTLARRTPSWQGAPRNIVIVLEESLGAQFIGSLGGRPLSPNYDRLSRQGWALDRLYATGTRSVRGIEAVVAGFAPTPAEAVVKRARSQQGFFTLAEVLRRRGYDTTFYYGGESHFDNMRGFFLGNGFARVIEQKDFRNPGFEGTWGVSDEDLFARADAEFRQLHAQGKPFFGLVFTSSNHEPFEFPDGRIALYEQPKQTRDNAAKYADHALSTLFKRAMAAPYWNDTVFLVVADHDSRVFGRDLVPVDNFHIPGLFLGGGIAPRRDDRVASQVDLGPTLLSLAGIDAATPMVGRDLADASLHLPGRALMQYDRNFAFMQGDEVVVLQPGRPPAQYRHERDGGRLMPMALSPALAHEAHAQALWGSLAYDHGWYRLPAPASVSAPAGR